jgi:hypothetical protein
MPSKATGPTWATLAVAIIGSVGVVAAAWLARPSSLTQPKATSPAECRRLVRQSWAGNLRGRILSDERALYDCLSQIDRHEDPSLYSDVTYLLLLCSRERYIHSTSGSLPALAPNKPNSSLSRRSSTSVSPSTCEQYRREYADLPPEEPRISLDSAVLEQVVNTRTCIASYPWPDGTSLQDVTAEKMAKLRDSTEAFLRETSTYRTEQLLAVAADPNRPRHEAGLAFSLAHGRDPNLLQMYGDLLYMIVLSREGKHDKLVSHFFMLQTRYDLRAQSAPFDDAASNTYFTAPNIINLFLVLYYNSVPQMSSISDIAVNRALASYLGDRLALQSEIGLIGDPYPEFMERIGCNRLSADESGAK